ncbi:interleukin-15 receptor subunit alpha isoform X1 [Hoplias malabaricus]|uniref:interleukin-15 receptor subunit alpha isoform X1 n=1 Tax=Hoplias malabaricus TaxID=27720 RepID=UPI003461C20C
MLSPLFLTLVLITAEYPFHIIVEVQGKCEDPVLKENQKLPDNVSLNDSRFRMLCVDGYLRKAGTSNLFKCNNLSWVNEPTLECISLVKTISTTVANTQVHSSTPNVTFLTSSTPVKTLLTTMGKTQSPSTVSVANTQVHTPTPNVTYLTSSTPVKTLLTTMGKTQIHSTVSGQSTTTYTTTHTVATTTEMTLHTTLRTTTKEETTPYTITYSASTALKVKEHLTSVSSQSTHSSTSTIITTGAYDGGKKETFSEKTKGGIAVGTLLFFIVAAASAVGVCFWCKRRRNIITGEMEMRLPTPDPDELLLGRPQDSVMCEGAPEVDLPHNPNSCQLLIVQS